MLSYKRILPFFSKSEYDLPFSTIKIEVSDVKTIIRSENYKLMDLFSELGGFIAASRIICITLTQKFG